MNKIYFFAVMLAVIFFYSCSEDMNTTQNPQAQSYNIYFPVLNSSVLLRWVYQYSGINSDTELVVESNTNIVFNNRVYSRFISHLIPSKTYDTAYYRSDKNGNIYVFENNSDKLYIEFSGREAEKNENYYFVRRFGDTVKVPFGTFYNCAYCVKWLIDIPYNHYAKNVGLISSEWEGGWIALKEFGEMVE